MSRNNEKNIRKHNDKLHKAQAKEKSAKALRKERLQMIIRKHTENQNSEDGK